MIAASAPLEPDVAALLAAMRAAHRPTFESLGVAEARAMYLAGRDTVQLRSVPVFAVEACAFGEVPARRYRFGPAARGTILFVHGGGYVIGDLDTHDSICRHLAVASESDVVAIDYRRAPEHRFPAAFIDSFAAYSALSAAETPLAIAGDSAGAALALAVALAARDAGQPPPRALAFFYPVTDIGTEAPSYAKVRDVPIGAATMRWFWNHYLDDPVSAVDWRASPLRATSLGGLPPMFVTTAGHDPLCDEGLALVARVRTEGGSVIHRHLPGQIHGYLTLGRLTAEAERSIVAAGAFLHEQLSR